MSDPSVLLVHGFATSAQRTWGDNGWLDLLADAGRSVVAPDLLGHGDAPKPHDPEAYTELEALVLDQLPAEPVDAIGFSLGARTVLALASAHPERFGRLVVAGIGANVLRRDGDPSVVADALVAEGPADDPVLRYFQQLAHDPGNDPAALAALLRRPRSMALDPAGLGRITSPVLIVLGERDLVGPADPLAACLSDVEVVGLPGVDHFGTPKAFGFLDAALGFLGAVPA